MTDPVQRTPARTDPTHGSESDGKPQPDQLPKAETPPPVSPLSEGSTVEDLRQSVDLLIREMGRIQQGLARLEGQLSARAETAEAHTGGEPFRKILTEIKDRVYKEAISSGREFQAIRKAVADLQTKVETLQQSHRFASRTNREIPEEHQRVGIFVDVQNIFYAAKLFNARLDFEKLLKVGVGRRRLVRAIAYVVQSPEVDQTGFISMLQQKSYEVRRKDLRLRSDGSAKGDWDMGMAIDIMGLVDKLDVVSIVSGDGDFVSLINLIKTIGPRVEVISFQHNTARDLIHSADLHVPIEETLLMRPPSSGAGSQSSETARPATGDGGQREGPSQDGQKG